MAINQRRATPSISWDGNTDRARKSARDAAINQKPTELPQIWSLFRAMSTKLHDLHFDRETGTPGDIVNAFEACTPFGLSLTETGMTKDDAELMRVRRDVYDGSSIDITPHVKYGDNRPSRLLRVYYHAHHES